MIQSCSVLPQPGQTVDSLLGDQMTACFILTLHRCSWCIQNKIFIIIFLNSVLIGVHR